MAAGTSHTTISIKLNEQGFHDIFNKYCVPLCLFANQYTENQETSADIVQDSFAKLWQIREDFFYLHQVSHAYRRHRKGYARDKTVLQEL